ncbi:MAG: sterol desaturase family protein [Deltaproteobacteria bacterium]|nr:sterol desaturase family protein [Deltaproteobacteria bacterium]
MSAEREHGPVSHAEGEPVPGSLGEVVSCFFRHGSPLILAGALVAALGARTIEAGWSLVDLAIASAVVALWPIEEWLIHVFVLHFRPKKVGRWTLDLPVAKTHRLHHESPWRVELVFIPLHVYLFIPGLAALAFAIAPTRAYALTYLVAFFVLSLHYEWVHLLVHTRYKPRSWLYARLWKNHRLHHFKNEAFWYGVTMLSGDRILRTAPDKGDVPTSPTARSLLASNSDE